MMKIFFFLFIFVVGKCSEFDPTKHKNWNLLPHKTCGQASSERIIGGDEAPMNGYPWLARISYASSLEPEVYLCGGAVLTSEIILTAAHCVTELEQNMKLYKIRLGEHDTTTNPDCDGSFCADPVMDFEPAEVILRPDYNEPPYKNDIALIRLKKHIRFSDFIKPICFPSGAILKDNFLGTFAEVAGWGITDFDKYKIAEILQVVRLPIIQNTECNFFLPKEAVLGPTQLCAGGIKGKDSCGGDSGGPLMKIADDGDEPRYTVIGIVSFGAKRCGKTRAPAVYTKLFSFMEWILDNLVHGSNSSVVVRQ